MPKFQVVPLPREQMSWEDFLKRFPENAIALDGIVRGGPRSDLKRKCFNFDHHDCVVREATMSTAMQVLYAIKGGIMGAFKQETVVSIVVNDTDQDTALACWLLMHYKEFEGTKSIPPISRLLELTNRLDITAGAFPMNLSEKLVGQHNWVFRPYTDLRKSGGLATASTQIMSDNLDAVMSRIDRFMMSDAESVPLDTRHKILYDSPEFKIVDEIGGNEARYYLFSKGMDAFVSRVAIRPDGRTVWSIGKRSQHIDFPLEDLYDDLNAAEGLTRENGWNGSTIIGGSSRMHGSSLAWETIRDIIYKRLVKNGILQAE